MTAPAHAQRAIGAPTQTDTHPSLPPSPLRARAQLSRVSGGASAGRWPITASTAGSSPRPPCPSSCRTPSAPWPLWPLRGRPNLLARRAAVPGRRMRVRRAGGRASVRP
eukprot:3999522-Prymnesium_polylepis.1